MHTTDERKGYVVVVVVVVERERQAFGNFPRAAIPNSRVVHYASLSLVPATQTAPAGSAHTRTHMHAFEDLGVTFLLRVRCGRDAPYLIPLADGGRCSAFLQEEG